MSLSEDALWHLVRDRAGPYKPAAFAFVQTGLRYTAKQLFDQPVATTEAASAPADRHVTGQQLCMGLREFATLQFGLLARTVLASWCITRTEDFGRIVFALVDSGLLRKTPQDNLEDFAAVYDFDEVFGTALERC